MNQWRWRKDVGIKCNYTLFIEAALVVVEEEEEEEEEAVVEGRVACIAFPSRDS